MRYAPHGQSAGERTQVAQRDAKEETPTLSRVAYERIRQEILAGTLVSDQPLRLEALRDRYGLSFSPLREALNQLQAERLVILSSKRGFRVAPFSLVEMWDALNTRILIESEAMRLSVANGDDDWEGAVVSSFHALEKSRQRVGMPDVSEAELANLEARHQAFHTTLLAACPSTLLLQLSATLYAQTERYRRPLLTMQAPETVSANPDGDHRAMMAAALARDADRAVELLREHLRGTGRFIEAAHARRELAAA